MAKAYIMDFDGGTTADYDWVMEEMALGTHLPPGARFHCTGATETGLRVIDVWDDPAAFDRFAAERIGPITGRRGMAKPAVEVIDVAADRNGPLEMPAIAQVVRLPGLDQAGFRALDDTIVADDRFLDGLVHHVNGPYPGGWCVIDTWTSAAKLEAFLDAHVRPNAPSAPLSGPPVFEVLQLHSALIEPAVTHA